MNVKNTAITYSGYDYQTLQGVYLLSQWLNSPTSYIKFAFDADSDSNATPQGIDDIVAVREDGFMDFWQVKFTPSPDKEENQFTWGWLLEIKGKTKRSRSILKKICDAISDVPDGKLGSVTLLTNKPPNRDMDNCLSGNKINYLKIDDDTKKRIIDQLGSEANAVALFTRLVIQHSEANYDTLSRTIKSELLKHSDDSGIARLRDRSREWAMFKNRPTQDGWIYLHNVREILSTRRPDPIPEIFEVPPDYCLPNEDFHDNLIEEIKAPYRQIITLTGKPGVGKSTYLSYLCQTFEHLDIPLIRHHYYLALGDTTEDRLSPRIVAESLLHQIATLHHEANIDISRPEDLRQALEQCAQHYKQYEKPFVVLIDGLDHVWRDNNKNRRPLDETFRQLIPVIDNMILLIGTQPVDDSLLPQLLLKNCPKDQWMWLPEMSGNSIFAYLQHQVSSNRLTFNGHSDQKDEQIKECAEKLLELTNGYPLHIIYSSEYLAQNNLPLFAWEIENLPPCSDRDIDNYYGSLWERLNFKQKDALHLCSSFQFAWPRIAIGEILEDDTTQPPSVAAVSHMLAEGLTGLRPFHESLVMFVRKQDEHEDRVNQLLPPVCEWLESKAPKFLKDSWLWSCIARSGDTSQLRSGLTRDWAIEKLAEGVSVETCIRLLSEAETYAFEDLCFEEAYRHRSLKTRLINGPEFQTWNEPGLSIASLLHATKDAINNEISKQNELTPIKLSNLATTLWFLEEYQQAEVIAGKALDRYRTKNKLLRTRHHQEEETEATNLIKACVLTDTLNYDAIFENDNFANWPDGYVSAFTEACTLKKDLDSIFRGLKALPSDSHLRRRLELSAIRISLIEGADISARNEYSSFDSQELSTFLNTYKANQFSNVQTFHLELDTESKLDVSDSSYYDWFFSCLCMRLNASGDFSWLPVKANDDRSNYSELFFLLYKLADEVAGELISQGSLDFDFLCSLFPVDTILDQMHPEIRSKEIMLKRDWVSISSDIHFITTQSKISDIQIQNAISTNVFRSDWIRLWYIETKIKLLSDEAAHQLIYFELDRQSKELEETIEYSNSCLELAEIAYLHQNTEKFIYCLQKTWDFVLGYGHHKDPTIFDVLKAIEYLSISRPNEALQLLERISPIVFNISAFTDGDQTRYSKHSISSLAAKLNPQTAASIYDQELVDGEWYYSEETILRLLQQADFSSPIVKHIYLTGLHSNCYALLKDKIKVGNENADKIREAAESLLGISIDSDTEKKEPSSSSIEKPDIDPSKYPPSKYKDLIDALAGKYATREVWTNWYSYWVENGKEKELLDLLLPLLPTISDRLDDKHHLLDLLFLSQLKFNGKGKAFDLLVRAHNAANGWSDWYESTEKSLNRLEVLANNYPKKIDEFIQLTTTQPDKWKDRFGKLIIPNDKLVYLLSISGRTDEALQLTSSMVSSLEDSIRNLTLKKPDWDWNTTDSIEDALSKTLVSRLKLPVPSIKLWVIDQISQLLIDTHPNIEKLVLKDLSSRKLESECIEVLCLIFIAKEKGYLPPKDLGLHIHSRSLLSDTFLLDIEPGTTNLGSYITPASPMPLTYGDNNRFEYFQGTHVPRIYYSNLKKEERRSGFPFTEYFKSEWNNTFNYRPPSGTAIDYFLNEDRWRNTGQFYSEASHRGRSAYLRAIQVAINHGGMPVRYAEQISTPAIPIEPTYIDLSTDRPEWLAIWDKELKPTEKHIRDYILLCKKNHQESGDDEDLVAFSTPIRIDENNWIDLTVSKGFWNSMEHHTPEFRDNDHGLCIAQMLERSVEFYWKGNSKEGDEKFTFLTAKTFPVLRYGHWHTDLETRGFYAPISRDEDKKIHAKNSDGFIKYELTDRYIGKSSYWYNHWKATHPKELDSLCGTYTTIYKDEYSNALTNYPENEECFYLCKAVIISGEDSFREFNSITMEFIISNNYVKTTKK
ncbi:MAG: NACHT domain-containing protein [Saccharospirillum sp.]|uniref:NACHT domain-containing protein n=3 Tax=Saccharospirillum sp. TaxID=2033801 RepID=UPI003297DEB2